MIYSSRFSLPQILLVILIQQTSLRCFCSLILHYENKFWVFFGLFVLIAEFLLIAAQMESSQVRRRCKSVIYSGVGAHRLASLGRPRTLPSWPFTLRWLHWPGNSTLLIGFGTGDAICWCILKRSRRPSQQESHPVGLHAVWNASDSSSCFFFFMSKHIPRSLAHSFSVILVNIAYPVRLVYFAHAACHHYSWELYGGNRNDTTW